MCVKLPLGNLNPIPYPPYPINIYTYGVTTAQLNIKSNFETKLTNNTQISYQNNKNKNPNQLIALGITNNE